MASPLQPREPRVTVNKEFASAKDFVVQYVSNVSASGLFVRCEQAMEVGALVDLNFTIVCEDLETITGIGAVVRVQQDPAGVGIEFRTLTEESVELIERLIAEHEGRQ